MMGDELRVRSREGEEVRFSRAAARRAGTLADWLEDTGGDGAFSAPPVPTAALRLIAAALEEEEQEGAGPGGGGAALGACSLAELAEVITGANFLAADAAVALASRELDQRLEGKGVGELRSALGAAVDLSEAEAAAALAEPAFVPPGSAPAAGAPLASSDDGPLAAQRSLSSSLGEDALGEALSEVGAATLVKLKGVSAAWRARARGELCARLCGRGGQRAPQPPARLDGITDLDAEGLRRAGRPWEAAAAGRLLPGLARLHGWGFAVDVAAVRTLDLSGDGPRPGQEAGFPRLRGCVSGEGEAPLELLLAVAACAASTDVCGVPVVALREDDSLTELDLSDEDLGGVGARLLALLVSGNAVLTELDVSWQGIGAEGAKALASALEVNAVLTKLDLSVNELCGLDPYTGEGTYTAVGITAIAEALKVNSVLTELNLRSNSLGTEGWCAIFNALKENKENKIKTWNLTGQNINDEIAKSLAEYVSVSAVLTSLDLCLNSIGDKGAIAIAEGLKVNAVLTSLNLYNNGVGVEGAKALASSLEVNAVLTSLDLRANELNDEARAALRAAAKSSLQLQL